MTKKRWTVGDKAKIVAESPATSASTVDICKKYGLSPNTFYPWRERFLDGSKVALAGSPGARAIRTVQKENATLRTLVGEIALANDLLKKALEGRNDGDAGDDTVWPKGASLVRCDSQDAVLRAQEDGRRPGHAADDTRYTRRDPSAPKEWPRSCPEGLAGRPTANLYDAHAREWARISRREPTSGK